MAYYSVCSSCGCNLDPGEKCDCENEKKEAEQRYDKIIRVTPKTGQMAFVLDRKEFGYAKTAY